jgi:hypothetical protein
MLTRSHDQLETKMIKDLLTAEIGRQKKTLDRLPADFVYPLFNSRYLIESQRRSGYRNTAFAAREIVDNALEAGTTWIDIVFERPERLAQHERKDGVRSIAFIDNGSGMLPDMVHYAQVGREHCQYGRSLEV